MPRNVVQRAISASSSFRPRMREKKKLLNGGMHAMNCNAPTTAAMRITSPP